MDIRHDDLHDEFRHYKLGDINIERLTMYCDLIYKKQFSEWLREKAKDYQDVLQLEDVTPIEYTLNSCSYKVLIELADELGNG